MITGDRSTPGCALITVHRVSINMINSTTVITDGGPNNICRQDIQKWMFGLGVAAVQL